MTGEEMERAIDFLLKSQANLEQRIEETNRQLGSFADTQAGIMRVMTRTFESQSEINNSLRAAIGELARATDSRLTETDERLNRLAELVEHYIIEGRNGKE